MFGTPISTHAQAHRGRQDKGLLGLVLLVLPCFPHRKEKMSIYTGQERRGESQTQANISGVKTLSSATTPFIYSHYCCILV